MNILEGYILGKVLLNQQHRKESNTTALLEQSSLSIQQLSELNKQYQSREDLYKRFAACVCKLEMLIRDGVDEIPQDVLNLYCTPDQIMDYEVDLYNDLRRILVEICKIHGYTM